MPSFPTFIVVTRDYELGVVFRLATRTVFESRVAAEAYAAGIAASREALIVEGDFHDLRVGEERGTLAYWQRKRRELSDVLTHILSLVPADEQELRTALLSTQDKAFYRQLEGQAELWSDVGAVLFKHLGAPPLDGWREEVRKLFMGAKQ